MQQLLCLSVSQRFIDALLTPFYFLFQSKKLLLRFAMLVMSVGMMSGVVGQATVTTDKLDYSPGSTAIITGTGFQPGEYVELHVHHADGDSLGTDPQYHHPWFVTADSAGNFITSWYVPTQEEGDAAGATLKLAAHGNMGSEAEWIFTDSVSATTIVTPTGFATISVNPGGTINVPYAFTYVTGGTGTTTATTGSTTSITYNVYLRVGGTDYLIAGPVTQAGLSNGTHSVGSAASPLIASVTFNGVGGNPLGSGGEGYSLKVDVVKNNGSNPGSNSATANNWVQVSSFGSIASVSVGAQSVEVTYGTAGAPTYSVTSLRGSNGTVNGTYSVSGLPAGVTSGGFSPSANFTATGGNAFPGATLTLNVSASVGAGSYNFTVSLSDGSNTVNATGTLVVSPRTITVTPNSGQNKTYGDADPTYSYGFTPALIGSDAFSGALSRVAGENVGNYNITQGTLALSSNYDLVFVSGVQFEIKKLTITVTPNSGQNKTYGDADPTYSYGFTPALIGSDAFSGALSRVAGENVGNYNITQGTLALSSNYDLVFVSGVQFEIKKLTITVTPNSGQNKTYGDADPTYSYGFTPALIGSDAFSGALSRVAGENVGNYNITQGTLALSSNYDLVFVSGVQFEIKKLTITVTPNSGQNKTYGDADPTYSYGFTPALIGSDAFSGALSRVAGENVGNYNITQGTLALSSNYDLVFVSGVQFEIKKLTITVTPNSGQNKTYGDADPTYSYGFTPALIGSDAFSGALSRVAGENVGNYNITQGTLALSSNYDLVFVSGVQFEIKKLTITVTPNSGQNKTYGDADPTYSYGFTPALIGSDAFSGALSRVAGENVGNYNITQGTLALSSNYDLVFVSGVQFEIKKLTITVTPNSGQNKTYGDADPTYSYGFTPALIGSDAFSGALSRVAGENVGNYNITQGTLALSSNYDLVFVSGVQFEIKKLTITVTPNSGQNKTYGDADPTYSYGFTPALIGSDAFSGALSRVAGENVGNYNITQGTLALSSNYDLVFVSGVQFEIKKLTITVTPNSGQNKTYGDADPTYSYGFTPALIGSDAFSGALSRVAGENVGNYNITQGTLALSSNYDLVFVSGVQFEIKKLTITVTPNSGQNKTYGDADPTYSYGFTPALIGSDAFSGALSRVAGENVGNYNITQGTLALSSNYDLVFVSGVQFEIKKLTITVTPNSGQNKTYGDADPTYSYGFTPALIGSDAFSGALSRVAGENVGNYNITQGTLALSSNYDLVFVSGVQFEIKKLTITVTPNSGQNKTYGDADPTYSYGFTPALIGSDAFSGALSRVAGENVGNYNITQGTLALSSNYDLVFVSGVQFEIKKLTITVTPNSGQNKTYGDADPTYSYGFTPALIGSDAFSGALSRVAGENVGNYNITQGTLALSSNYDLVFVSGVQFEIKKLAVTVTADAKTKYCGQLDPSLTFVSSPAVTTVLANGQVISFTGSLLRVAGESVSVYQIQQGSLDNSNYQITYIPADFSILGVAIDASASSTPVPETVGTATLSATVTSVPGGAPLSGVSVTFVVTDDDGVVKSTQTVLTNLSGVATASVSGLTLGVYKVVATAGSACGSSVAYIPVYDPNGSFVTGGGWISSPSGALVVDGLPTTITGKANFGFVSKYKKGSSIVDGNTEFQFHAGDINFKSTMHESGSLVISGAKATYRGTGTINGLAGYKFTIVAIDGNWNNGFGPDKFRIKITTTTGTVIYDNQMGEADNADATTALGGGSIVIHEVKKKAANRMEPGVLILAPKEFNVKVLGNPSLTTFHLQLQSNNMQEKFTVKVVDINGRLIEVKQNLYAGQVVELGSKYTQGTYFAEVMQGANRKVVKLIKIGRD